VPDLPRSTPILVTSRKPDVLPAFNRKMIETFAHARAGAR
jgi:hypothetical protein